MANTLEQELLLKKEKEEGLLAEEIRDRNDFSKKIGKDIVDGFDANKSLAEDCDVKIEALQEFIEGIDRYLKEKAM